jgi:hypothetical protein
MAAVMALQQKWFPSDTIDIASKLDFKGVCLSFLRRIITCMFIPPVVSQSITIYMDSLVPSMMVPQVLSCGSGSLPSLGSTAARPDLCVWFSRHDMLLIFHGCICDFITHVRSGPYSHLGLPGLLQRTHRMSEPLLKQFALSFLLSRGMFALSTVRKNVL